MDGKTLVNHLMYADDLAILSSSSTDIQQLLNICSAYGMKYDVHYNAKEFSWVSVRKQNTWAIRL